MLVVLPIVSFWSGCCLQILLPFVSNNSQSRPWAWRKQLLGEAHTRSFLTPGHRCPEVGCREQLMRRCPWGPSIFLCFNMLLLESGISFIKYALHKTCWGDLEGGGHTWKECDEYRILLEIHGIYFTINLGIQSVFISVGLLGPLARDWSAGKNGASAAPFPKQGTPGERW